MPERRKIVLQNTKTRAATFACFRRFHKTRVRTFFGRLAQTPSRISRCLRATCLSATVIHCHLFFLRPAYFSFFADNFHAQLAAHPAQFLPAARTLRFHYFFVPKYTHSFASRHAFFRRQPAVILPAAFLPIPSTSQSLALRLAGYTLPASFLFKAISAFHQPSHFLPALACRHLTRSILINPHVRASRSGLPATTPPAPFSFKAISAFHQPLHTLPAQAGCHFARSILIHPQARATRSGFAGRIHTTSPISFQSKQSQPFISHHTFFRRQPAVILPAAFLSHKSHSTHIRLRRPVPHHQHQTNY